MPQRVVPSEKESQPKGCMIASAIFFIALIGLLVYAAVQIAQG